jgi:hypothetical protein
VQHPTRTLVSIDIGLDEQTVRAALPASAEIQIVGVVSGVDESWTTLQETPTDLLVVACTGYSERALFLIGSVVKERPGMPVVVLAHDAPEVLRRVPSRRTMRSGCLSRPGGQLTPRRCCPNGLRHAPENWTVR